MSSRAEEELWTALQVYQAANEIAVPFAATVVMGMSLKYSWLAAIPAGLAVYVLSIARHRMRVRRAQAALREERADG